MSYTEQQTYPYPMGTDTIYLLSAQTRDVVRCAMRSRVSHLVVELDRCATPSLAGYWIAQLWQVDRAARELGLGRSRPWPATTRASPIRRTTMTTALCAVASGREESSAWNPDDELECPPRRASTSASSAPPRSRWQIRATRSSARERSTKVGTCQKSLDRRGRS